MFPNMPVQGNKHERKLLKIYKALDKSNQESLMAFAEFLQTREAESSEFGKHQSNQVSGVVSEPLKIERPESESVIKAIKRLTATYPMVDKENILHPISDLMTAHMLQGRPAKEVIDDLEAVFLKEYNQL